MKIYIEIEEYQSINDFSTDEANLIIAAKEACKKAYAPHSNFYVGAAALLEDGRIVTGNNQENIAYPSGICAERTALFYANSQFPNQRVKTLAVAAFQNGKYELQPVSPCGACRQVMLETESRYGQPMRIILVGEEKIYVCASVKDLLPLSFVAF